MSLPQAADQELLGGWPEEKDQELAMQLLLGNTRTTIDFYRPEELPSEWPKEVLCDRKGGGSQRDQGSGWQAAETHLAITADTQWPARAAKTQTQRVQ